MIGWDKQQIKVNTATQCRSKTQTRCFSSTNGRLPSVEAIRTEEGLQSLGRCLLCRLWKSQLWQLRKVVSQRNRLWRERWSIEEPCNYSCYYHTYHTTTLTILTYKTILLLPLLLRSLVTRLRRPYLGPIWVAQGSTGCQSHSSKPLF